LFETFAANIRAADDDRVVQVRPSFSE